MKSEATQTRQLLQEALHHHQSGRLDEAESLYRRILGSETNQPDAVHLLGVIAQQRGEYVRAITLIRQAIELKPSVAMYHNNLGNTYKAYGQTEEALACYQIALQIQPSYSEALGNLGIVLQAQGRLDEAITSYEQSLVLKPDYVEALYNLATARRALGQRAEAITHFQKAVDLRKDFWPAHFQLAQLLVETGRLHSASGHFRQAIAANPDLIEAYIGLGAALQLQEQFDQALQLYDRLLVRYPQCAEALCNRGTVLKDLGRLQEAEESFRRALTYNPKLEAAHYNLANALQLSGNLAEATASYRRALAFNPEWIDARNNLGNVLQAQGMLAEADRELKKVLQLAPESANAFNNLGNVYKHQGHPDLAINCYRQALALKPDHFEVHSNLLFALSTSATCLPSEYLEEARHFGLKVQAAARPSTDWTLSEPLARGRLRVGIVSGDLKSHPVGFFLESVLANLNVEHVEVIAYSTRLQEDDLTARLRKYLSRWRSIAGMKDEAAANLIHQDGIDILLDLAGHTAHNRLPLFAWKPAPVQASWLGYFASTGVPGMDFVLADPISVPKSARGHFTERIWYLPETRLCLTPPDPELEVAPLPALRNGHVTYGCCQALSKLSPEVLQAWGAIMSRQAAARLRIQNKQLNCLSSQGHLLACLEKVGINPERVTLLGAVARTAYLQGFAEIDIALDTFPYPGGTTTCEALWMGVPTLTLTGKTMLARQGASLMSAAGLPGFVTSSSTEYIDKAVALGKDITGMAELRQGMRQLVRGSALFDGRQFARYLEEALWGMWEARRS